MSADEKLIAFRHGALGDETCDHLVVPKHLNIRVKLQDYYSARAHMTFADWLKEHFGARAPCAEELEEIDE